MFMLLVVHFWHQQPGDTFLSSGKNNPASTFRCLVGCSLPCKPPLLTGDSAIRLCSNNARTRSPFYCKVHLHAGKNLLRDKALAAIWAIWLKLWVFLGNPAIASVATGLSVYYSMRSFQYGKRPSISSKLLASKLVPKHVEKHIHRSSLEDKLASLVRELGDNILVVFGNHAVGKSDIISRVMAQYPGGVISIFMGEKGSTIQTAMLKFFGAQDMSEVRSAFLKAAKEMHRKPTIVVDIPRKQNDTSILDDISTFCKEWACEENLATIIVVASCASSALVIDPDGRRQDFFLPPLTWSEMQNTDVKEFLHHHGGKETVEHIREIFAITGGNIGRLKEVATYVKGMGYQEAKALFLERIQEDVDNFFTIDRQGGIGPEKVVGAADLAKGLVNEPFEGGVLAQQVHTGFSKLDVAEAIRRRAAHCLWLKRQRYFAMSLAHYAFIKQKLGMVLSPEEQATITSDQYRV